MIQFQENARTEGRTERRKDGQTLFHRTLPATAGNPKTNLFFIPKIAIFTFIFMNLTKFNVDRFFSYDNITIFKTTHLILYLYHFMNFVLPLGTSRSTVQFLLSDHYQC